MAEISRVIQYTIDVDAPVIPGKMAGVLVEGDQEADTIMIVLKRGNEYLVASELVRSAVALVTNEDGQTIRNPGTVEDAISITFSRESYAVAGYASIEVEVTYSTTSRTILMITARVEPNGRGILIDPTDSIPSTEELAAMVQELQGQADVAAAAAVEANRAATAANTAADTANTYAKSANTAATAANNAAAAANAAAGSVTAIVGGRAYETNADSLSALTTAQRASLYQQGYRMIKAIKNDTVVALGLDSAGGTQWLASNMPTNNLLDNSDFRNPVNQRGVWQPDAYQYGMDRWRANNTALTITHNSNGITVPISMLVQYMDDGKMIAGEKYTAAVYLSTGTKIAKSFTYEAHTGSYVDLTNYTQNGVTINVANESNNHPYFAFYANSTSIVFRGVALYPGDYTADTLPMYTPKGYAAELLACQRYYKKFNGLYPTAVFAGDKALLLPFHLPVEMRGVPSVTLEVISHLRGNGKNITNFGTYTISTYVNHKQSPVYAITFEEALNFGSLQAATILCSGYLSADY